MRVIGAGLPRTGTSSLRDGLRVLLGGPVYHMSEAIAHPDHTPHWVAAISGLSIDWDVFLRGYVAGVDAPFSNCWQPLARAYPQAVVLLSRRADAKSWLASMRATVLPRARQVFEHGPEDPMEPLFRAVFKHLFTDLDDGAGLIHAYESWNEHVRNTVPASRLLEWEPADGWDPICEALGLPRPDVAFPHSNSTASYLARAAQRARGDQERMQANPRS